MKEECNGMKQIVPQSNIFVWENALSKEWCDELIELTNQKIEIGKGISDQDNQKRRDISLVMDTFGSMREKEHQLLKVLEQCVKELSEYTMQFGARSPLLHWCESICCKIQYTPPGGGFSEWHYEQGSGIGETARRWGVWMLYLNDVTEGGKTDFPQQELSVQPTAGTMVIWPAAWTHTHRSSPDLKQDKYIVTGWLQYYIDGESKRPQAESRL